MLLDVEKYMPYVAHIDAPPERKEEMIRTVWGMLESCVDQAFGTHPVQLALGKAREPQEFVSQNPPISLDSKEALTQPFNLAADTDAAARERQDDEGE